MRVAQLAAIIAAEEGADAVRASFLALWHDSQETRTGDRDIGVHRVDGWIDSACKGFKTTTAQRIAAAAASLSPLARRDR